VFLLVILFMPRGIVPSAVELYERWRARTGPSAPAPVQAATP